MTAATQTNIYDVQAVWAKYEDVAMHFNDLLMRLRTQALAGVAAISAVVGIFTKSDTAAIQLDWIVAGWLFIALAMFWIAIACLDLLYYNRLLLGAVNAITSLERQLKAAAFSGIDLSTHIEAEFDSFHPRPVRMIGVTSFYVIVFFAIAGGAAYSFGLHHAGNP